MAPIVLSLVVIRSADPQRSVEFYQSLGIEFIKEQHGNGPEHYASEVGPTVLEIYPRKSETQSTSSVRLGFRVPSVDAAIAALMKLGAEIVTQPSDSPWGRRAVVADPDGHRVELMESTKE